MPTENKERQAALNAATNAADRRLRAAHQDEWNDYKAAEAKERGQEWSPKQTDEEKAAAQLFALLTEFPHLADAVGQPKSGPSQEYRDTSSLPEFGASDS